MHSEIRNSNCLASWVRACFGMKPRILVIRGGAIGDFVLTLPAIRLLRENFPQAHLEILGYKHIVALAEGRFYADATRSIEYGGLSRFFVPDAELPEDLVEYFVGFQQIVSYLYDPDRFFEENVRRAGVRYYLHGSPKLNDSAHAVQQLAQPLESLALYLEEKAPVLFPSEADKEFAAEYLGRAFPGRAGPLVALHPGSGGERKNWPVEKWMVLGKLFFGWRPRRGCCWWEERRITHRLGIYGPHGRNATCAWRWMCRCRNWRRFSSERGYSLDTTAEFRTSRRPQGRRACFCSGRPIRISGLRFWGMSGLCGRREMISECSV